VSTPPQLCVAAGAADGGDGASTPAPAAKRRALDNGRAPAGEEAGTADRRKRRGLLIPRDVVLHNAVTRVTTPRKMRGLLGSGTEERWRAQQRETLCGLAMREQATPKRLPRAILRRPRQGGTDGQGAPAQLTSRPAFLSRKELREMRCGLGTPGGADVRDTSDGT